MARIERLASLDDLLKDAGRILAEWGVNDGDNYLLAPVSQAVADLFAPFPDSPDRAAVNAAPAGSASAADDSHQPMSLERAALLNAPRVSIVIPCYNAERFLAETISSALGQTEQDVEVIVVDDGSTDRTRDVVAKFDDPRVSYIYQENSGPAAARNTGIRAARGEYIAPLDSDDLALPHRLKAQIGLLEAHPDLSVVGSGYEWIDEESRLIPWINHPWRRWPELNDIRPWLFDCPFVPSATMFRRDAWEDVGGFDEELIGPEDWSFWMRLVLAGHRMGWHKDVVCLYRHRSGSVSHNAERQTAMCVRTLLKVMQDPRFPPALLDAGQQALALRYVDGVKCLYTCGLWSQGQAALKQALALDPELMAEQPCRIEDGLMNAALDPLIDDPISFLQSELDHLPQEAQALQARQEYMLSRCHLELLARGMRRRDLRLIRGHWKPVAAAVPHWFLDSGARAFVVRAIRNRCRFVADRINRRR